MTYYFLDEEKKDFVENCPSCSAIFLKDEGATCSLFCPAKQLEIRNRAVIEDMVSFCLGKRLKVTICCPIDKPIENKKWNWGETKEIEQIIIVPWFTLRSKRSFLNTVAHEVAHITAYRKKFSFCERRIIKSFHQLLTKHKKPVSVFGKEHELRKCYDEHKILLEKHWNWDDHEHRLWYQKYLKYHKKLINSQFVSYAYGYYLPRTHGFDEQGQGKYKPSIGNWG